MPTASKTSSAVNAKPAASNRLLDAGYYMESLLWIRSKDKRLIPFVLNKPQRDFLKRRSKRNIVLKARQIGFSTLNLALFYHDTITSEGTNTVLVAHKKEQAVEFLNIIKMFYAATPPQVRPDVKYANRNEMTFPALHSSIHVLAPTSDAGRGMTIHNLHASELAFWPRADETWASLFEAVPDDGHITVESTPNGIGNLFHRLYLDAVARRNAFKPFCYRWDWAYSNEWAAVRREEIGPRRWAQEYDCDFVQSGVPVFDRAILKVAPVQPVASHTLGPDVEVFQKPRDGVYVIGADVAEGMAHGDYSTAVVLDRASGRQAAQMRGRWPVEVFAGKLERLGHYYNTALLGVERNNHGYAVLVKLREGSNGTRPYPNLYRHHDRDGARASAKLGWLTNARTKPLMIDGLEEALRKRLVTLHSKVLVEELAAYQYRGNGSTSAPAGLHDDLVVALAIAWQVRKAPAEARGIRASSRRGI